MNCLVIFNSEIKFMSDGNYDGKTLKFISNSLRIKKIHDFLNLDK